MEAFVREKGDWNRREASIPPYRSCGEIRALRREQIVRQSHAAPSKDEEEEDVPSTGEQVLYEDQIEALRARAAVRLDVQDMIRRAERELSQLIKERLARETHLLALAVPSTPSGRRLRPSAASGPG
jgi:hypothetical protein